MEKYLKIIDSESSAVSDFDNSRIYQISSDSSIKYKKKRRPLTFKALQDNSSISIDNYLSDDVPLSLYYSKNNGPWTSCSTDGTTISLNKNDVVRFYGNNPNGWGDSGDFDFSGTGKIEGSGKIMSLISPECPEDIPDGVCFDSLFAFNTALTKAPELPTGQLTENCFNHTFAGCTGLTDIPELPSGKLATGCYEFMFSDCTGLGDLSSYVLPANTLKNSCYKHMFANCTGMTKAPRVLGTVLEEDCCSEMFEGCTGLTEAQTVLPATTMAEGCYQFMYSDCSSLIKAPELPATEAVNNCYSSMFSGCSSLNYIKADLLYDSDVTTSGISNGLSGVADTGTFVAHVDSYIPDSDPCLDLPSGWTIVKNEMLCFKALEDGSTISMYSDTNPVMYYSVNDAEYTQWDYSEITLNLGDHVHFYGDNPDGFSTDWTDDGNFFIMTGTVQGSGNIMSLISKSCPLNIPGEDCFYDLFSNCTSLTKAPELPATELVDNCYDSMFYGCTGLTEAPELPATELATYCYCGMFSGCTGLTEAPSILPATTLAEGCYCSMFEGCTGLTEAPVLPATELATYCYQYMFYGCTGLTEAPVLPATELATYCYQYMFSGCTGLTEAPVLPATTLAEGCYSNMFLGCTRLTKAPELPATTLAGYCYYYMFSGCTRLTKAPELPATTLAGYCYYSMFSGCTRLTEAPELPATTLAGYCYRYMFYGCTSLTKAPSILPATTLATYCYWSMFWGCTGLTEAPVLPATTLAEGCYSNMFLGCTNLKRITALFTTTPGSTYTNNWLSGVASSGTFIRPYYITWSVSGVSGIPSGWSTNTRVIMSIYEDSSCTILPKADTEYDTLYARVYIDYIVDEDEDSEIIWENEDLTNYSGIYYSSNCQQINYDDWAADFSEESGSTMIYAGDVIELTSSESKKISFLTSYGYPCTQFISDGTIR